MPLRAERDAGSRGPAQNAADALHPLLGLRAQCLGDLALPGGYCHLHGRLRLLVVQLRAEVRRRWSTVYAERATSF